METFRELQKLGVEKIEFKFTDKEGNSLFVKDISIFTFLDLEKYHSINGLLEIFNIVVDDFKNKV